MAATCATLTVAVILFTATTVCHSKLGHDAVKIREQNETLHEFIDRLFLTYHNLYRPVNISNPSQPTTVQVNLFINSFGYIDVRNMEYSVDIFLRQRWNEPRLQFDGHDDAQISLAYYKNKLWTPDLFFRNSKKSEIHQVTKPNYLIDLHKNGDILFSQKVSLTLSCHMQLELFPMDTQTCGIEIGSYGFRISELNFTWFYPGNHENNVQLNSELNLNEFYKPKINTFSCIKKYTTTGGFTCIRADLRFQRRINFYLIYTFVPSILIVGISWLSFFIDFTVIPGRITLGLLSMLTLMTQCASSIRNLPHVSYVKAIDIWLFACLTFVATTLIEFAIVCSVCTEDCKTVKKKKSVKKLLNLSGNASNEGSPGKHGLFLGEKSHLDDGALRQPKRFRFPKTIGHQVDRAFLVGFPVAFALFNLVYWFSFKQANY